MKKSIRILALFMALTFCTCCLSSCSKLFGKKYTVKWVNYDGTELEVDEKVPAGTVPEYNGEQPERPDDDNYHYEYRGWSPIVLPADADITYIADYNPTHKETGKHLLGGAASWYDDSVTWVMQNKSKLLGNVPGGEYICTAFDGFFGLVGLEDLQTAPDPLDVIKDKIDTLQNSIDQGFKDIEKLIASSMDTLSEEVKAEISQAERNIESLILSQTTIANKGDSFDSLMTAMESTERSIKAIMSDDTLSQQDKALSVARLIGNYSQWSDSGNLFASYLSFLDAVTKSTYGSTNDKILFDLVYDQQVSCAMFPGEAIAMGAPYIERILYLASYAYNISTECIMAAMTVANFTEDDLNQLNDANRAIYASVVSPYSVVATQSDYLNKKLLEIGFSDTSVMDRITEYFDINRHGGIVFYPVPGEPGIQLADKIPLLSTDYNMRTDVIDTAMACLIDHRIIPMSPGTYDFTKINALVNQIHTYHSDMTLRDFLTMVGYDLSNIPKDVHFITGYETEVSGTAAAFIIKYNAISIDDPNLTVNEVVIEGYSQGFVVATSIWSADYDGRDQFVTQP